MAGRNVEVDITGDPRPLQRAFKQAGDDAKAFSGEVSRSMGTAERSTDKAASAFQRLRAAGRETLTGRGFRQAASGALAFAGGTFAVTTGLNFAAAASRKWTGENSELSQGLGKLSTGLSAVLSLDFDKLFSLGEASEEDRKALAQLDAQITQTGDSTSALIYATEAEASGFADAADKMREHVAQLEKVRTAQEAAVFEQRDYNKTIIDGTTYLVEYKGAHDSAFPGTVAGGHPLYGNQPTPYNPNLPDLSPSQRRELDLIASEGMSRIPLLNDRLAQLNGQMEHFNGNQEQRLKILERIKQTEKEISGIYQTAADKRKADAATAQREREQAEREAERRRKAAAKLAADREQARQFRLIGLSGEGGEAIPGEANLRKQLAGLQARDDVPTKLRNRFAGIAKALAEPGGLTDKTRDAIRDFFRTVREEIKKGEKDQIAPYATEGVNTNRILAGLALTGAQRSALANRLAGVNIKGRALAPGPGIGAFGQWFGSGGGAPSVEVPVYIDGQKVGQATKRYTQRNGIHSPKQKRGPNAGR